MLCKALGEGQQKFRELLGHRPPIGDLRLIWPLKDSPDRPGDGVSGGRQNHWQRLNRFDLLRRNLRLRRVTRRNSLLLQSSSNIRAEDSEYLIGNLLDHAAAHLCEQAPHIDFRNAHDFGASVRKRLDPSGHLHRCAALVSDVLPFAQKIRSRVSGHRAALSGPGLCRL